MLLCTSQHLCTQLAHAVISQHQLISRKAKTRALDLLNLSSCVKTDLIFAQQALQHIALTFWKTMKGHRQAMYSRYNSQEPH